MGFEADAFSYNIYEDDWEVCDDATIVVMTPTGPKSVEVDGLKNTYALSWASDCFAIDCSFVINPL